MVKKAACVFDCGNEVKHVKSGLCGACYSAVYYWRKKSVTQMIAYASKLGQRAQRMTQIMRPSKVSMIRKRSAR